MHYAIFLHVLEKVDKLGHVYLDEIFTQTSFAHLDQILKHSIFSVLKDEKQILIIL